MSPSLYSGVCIIFIRMTNGKNFEKFFHIFKLIRWGNGTKLLFCHKSKVFIVKPLQYFR